MMIRFFLAIISLSLCLSSFAFAVGELPTDAEKKIVQITAQGLKPSKIKLSKLDASVFFYNASGSNVDKLSIDFGSLRVHCHNPSMELSESGLLYSTQPLIPNSFLIACFPEPATYPIKVTVAGREYRGEVLVPEVRGEK